MEWIYERGLSCNQIDDLINSWIFSERNRRILHRRFIDGVRIDALSEEFDLSVSQIKRIIAAGKNTLVSQCW